MKQIPAGILLINILLLLAMGTALVSLVVALFYVSGMGTFWLVYHGISLVVMGLIVIGLFMGKPFFRSLAIIWFNVEILFHLVLMVETGGSLVLAIAGILMNAFFIWYLVRREDYFEGKFDLAHPIIQREERIFMVAVIGLVVISFVIGFIIPQVVAFYQEVTVMNDISGKDVPEALEICRNGTYTDYCIFTVVETHHKRHDFEVGVCKEIAEVEYRDACYLVLDECAKIVEDDTKALCSFSSSMD
ncbi:MAG: hypothetical protein ACQESG_07850 [Nanobdellota archaeon]